MEKVTLKERRKKLSQKLNTYIPYLLGAWLAILSTCYSLLALIRHNNFQSGAFDLGIFDQAVWQYAHLLYPYNTIKERFILGDHFTLTLPLFAPFFYLWDDVRLLLILQAVWITFSAIAIYKIARVRNFSPMVGCAVAFVYSIFFGIQFGVYFDFHPIIFGVGLLAWLAYFFEAGKKKLFWGTLVVMLVTQENMGIALASLGCIYFFQKHYRKKAVFFIIGGIVASIIMVGIVSMLSPVGYQYQPKIAHDPLSITSQFFDTHEKRLVWLYSFSSFAFLPLLSPGSILAVILDLSQYFAAASEFGHMLTPYLHHRAILAVFLALGTLDALALLKKKKVDLLFPVGILVLTAMSLQYVFHFPLNKLAKQDYWQRASWMEDTDLLLKEVPETASIATTQNLVPHLTHRKEIYLPWPRQKSGKEAQEKCGEDSCWWFDFAGEPQYLIITVDDRQWITQLLESPQNIHSALTNMEKAGEIHLIQEIHTSRMYKIGN